VTLAVVGAATVAFAAQDDGTERRKFPTAWDFDPIAIYGDQIVFLVVRNGNHVGDHRVSFTRRGDELLVRTLFRVEVRFLLLTAYQYSYSADDLWRGGSLVSLRAETNDNGRRHRVEADVAGQRVQIRGPSGITSEAAGIFPTHHWHPGVLTTDRVLNTITGRINRVGIVAREEDWVAAGEDKIHARRYAYTGELSNEVWYDSAGRWVKMRFRADDGSTIEYVCQKCGRRPGGES
jgi:hypothetical protein